MTQHNSTEFRRPISFVIVGMMGFILPPAILVYTVMSGKLGEQDSSFYVMLGILWLMMLFASIPLWIEYRRFRVRLTEESIELRGWRQTKSMLISELRQIDQEPTKLILKDAAGKRRLEISTIVQHSQLLHQALERACEENCATHLSDE